MIITEEPGATSKGAQASAKVGVRDCENQMEQKCLRGKRLLLISRLASWTWMVYSNRRNHKFCCASNPEGKCIQFVKSCSFL